LSHSIGQTEVSLTALQVDYIRHRRPCALQFGMVLVRPGRHPLVLNYEVGSWKPGSTRPQLTVSRITGLRRRLRLMAAFVGGIKVSNHLGRQREVKGLGHQLMATAFFRPDSQLADDPRRSQRKADQKVEQIMWVH
jgi:hypothetical protein